MAKRKRKTITFERCYGPSYTLKPLADGSWRAQYMPDPFNPSTDKYYAPVHASTARGAADAMMEVAGRTLCPWNYLDDRAYKESIMGLRGGGSRARKAARKTASLTMATIKANNKRAGRHWFEPGAMRFFNTKLGSKVIKGKRCAFFVTSDKMRASDPAAYAVRKTCDGGGTISTVGNLRQYATRAQAEAAAKRLAAKS